MSIDQIPQTSGPAVLGGHPIPVLMADAEYIHGGFSGRFITLNSSGTGEICSTNEQTISGWVESGTDTSTSGLTVPCYLNDCSMIFAMPVTGAALAQTHVGALFDLTVSGGIQYVNLAASSHDLVTVVGGLFGTSAALSYALVMMNPEELYNT